MEDSCHWIIWYKWTIISASCKVYSKTSKS